MLKNFCTVKVLFITTVFLVVLLAGIIVLFFVGVPVIVEDQIEKNVRLDKGTIQWDRFVKLPLSFDVKVFLFAVTNGPDVVNNKAIPIMEEIGPYHYIEEREKHITGFNEDEDSVNFKQTMTIKFNQEASGNLTEEDNITVLNPIMIAISQVTSVLERFVIGGCLDKLFLPEYSKMLITVPVKMIIMDGIPFGFRNASLGPACTIVRKKLLDKTKKMKNVERILDPVDGEVDYLKFAYLQYKVREPDGEYTTLRGRKDINKLGTIIRWNGKPFLENTWGTSVSVNNDTCNRVRGTDSTLYPPHVTKNGIFEIFSTDICRYFHRGCASSPLTFIFSKTSNFTPLLRVNSHISSLVPGSWPAN
nr:unnamed protein product [Callosobruchus analis]